ncbi:cupin domain-containing protein [Nitrosophilus kaiyonis]|uniref:cupin domain-containing protein n=1 Tax=Nitrosophilus kaiyonis TaxID=2930200 RepID=UPI0024935E7A|nr:cupin domain-containing protein [Nitrosophilus kaiyonis]
MNFFDYETPIIDENFDTLFENKNIKIQRIVSSNIDTPKEFLQKENEWVILLKGEAEIEMNNKKYNIKKGEYIFIPSNTPHKLLKTKEGTLWLAIHFI